METSLKLSNENFKTNISIEGYSTFSTPSKSNKGGSTIYVKDSFDVTERLDLNSPVNKASNLELIAINSKHVFFSLVMNINCGKKFLKKSL